jgi:hypothetical protein
MVEQDYEEFLRLLNKNKVKYCVVGAFSVAFYTKPRYSKDIDILVEPTFENGRNILTALKEFGFGSLKISPKDFSKEGNIVQLGYEPVRVDLLTSIDGCTFDEVWKGKKRGNYGKEKVFFLGIKELIKNKKALNRPQDKADIKTLSATKKK